MYVRYHKITLYVMPTCKPKPPRVEKCIFPCMYALTDEGNQSKTDSLVPQLLCSKAIRESFTHMMRGHKLAFTGAQVS